MQLIKATNKDVQVLLEIEKTTIGLKTYSGYFQEEEIKKWISNDIVYIIKNDGKIIGSIAYEIKNNDHAYISGLVIKPEFRKQGLAKKATVKLLEELKNYKKIDLVTHPDNVDAVKLYESLGFIEFGRKENFFGDGESRIIMVKNK
ncbi:MAG TPA: GNAT family N-acetyltransferase [Candidatus Moranbacteria bacterium]|nr:GNAT family N-acetyltransferase [Candidatus Moranbacteria bacterium]